MPTYQYRCTDCGNELEAVQKFTDPALTECPTCTGQLRKVFNAVGVVFKGSGFYRTDSRSDGKKSTGSSSSSTADGSSSSAEKKTEKTTATPEKSGGKQPATAGSSTGAASSSGGSSTAA
jgi:putative FmdB family regulatory protein